ncbi:threonylcarbamoyl-AMP synthase [Candidatus Woesearchaeota archaeon]|nr:threonylcarbamoyl-AMP synthase [Candidatus Woesearchaeota archaeon]
MEAKPKMKVFKRKDFLEDLESHIEQMKYGAVFIYPTDTLYGIGCDARNNSLVQRIRRIKNSTKYPLSVIAPSKEWIRENMVVRPEHEVWLKKLPGPYTLIFERKVKDCVADDVNRFDNTLGVRIPKNWFADVVKKIGYPVITTSVNVHGQAPFTALSEISDNFKMMVDFAIEDGEMSGVPSTLVDLTTSPPKVIERK